MLELDRRDAHHEELRCSLGFGLEGLVVGSRHDNLPSTSLRPGVPVEDSIDVLMVTERGAWVDLVVAGDDEYVTHCLLEVCPRIHVLAAESGDHWLAVELEIRGPRDVALEVVGVVARVLEVAGCVIEREEETETKIVCVVEETVYSVIRPVGELV